MITPGFGFGELLNSFLVVAFNLALTLAGVCLLYKIYIKLKNIEDHIKNN
jgi:hypothetical protein